MSQDSKLEFPPRVAALIRDFAGRLLEADGLLERAEAELGGLYALGEAGGEKLMGLLGAIHAWREEFRTGVVAQANDEPRREEDPRE